MKRRPPTALLAAGNVTASSVLRSASVRESLGPVKAASLRVASRVVNLLRAGHAVEDFEEINECKVILAVAPRERTGALLEELRGSGMKLKNKYIVICGDGALPDPAGMRVARVREAAGFEGRWYVMDGNREAAADLRRILGPGVRLTILEGDATPLWDAAQALLERGLIAVSAAADDCLRRLSIAPAHTDELVERAFDCAVRAWMRGKRRVALPPLDDMDAQMKALRAVNPELAEWFAAVMAGPEAFLGAPSGSDTQ